MSSSPELRNSHRKKMAGMHNRLKALLARYRLLENVTKKEREMSEQRARTISRLRTELIEEQRTSGSGSVRQMRTPVQQSRREVFDDSPSLVRCVQMQKDVKSRRDKNENLGLNVQSSLAVKMNLLDRETRNNKEKRIRLEDSMPRNSVASPVVSGEIARVRAEFDILSMKFDTLKHRYESKCESAERERVSNAKALKMMQTEYESMCNIIDKGRSDSAKLNGDISSCMTRNVMLEQNAVVLRNEHVRLEGELKISEENVRYLEFSHREYETIESKTNAELLEIQRKLVKSESSVVAKKERVFQREGDLKLEIESQNELEKQLRKDLKIAQYEFDETRRKYERIAVSDRGKQEQINHLKQILSDQRQTMEAKMDTEICEMRRCLIESENERKTLAVADRDKSEQIVRMKHEMKGHDVQSRENRFRIELKDARDELAMTQQRWIDSKNNIENLALLDREKQEQIDHLKQISSDQRQTLEVKMNAEICEMRRCLIESENERMKLAVADRDKSEQIVKIKHEMEVHDVQSRENRFRI